MHVAIILGGNARWAKRHQLTPGDSCIAGAEAVRAVVNSAANARIRTLTLYAISASECAHMAPEVDALQGLFRRYLLLETERCVAQQIRIHVIGRPQRMDRSLQRAIEHSERLSRAGSQMQLRIVFDYGALDTIMRAAWRADRSDTLTAEAFFDLIDQADPSALAAGAVDLAIRTDRRTRPSDFMLWEFAYAERCFIDCLWPDFGGREFRQAFEDYSSRQSLDALIEETRECTSRTGKVPLGDPTLVES